MDMQRIAREIGLVETAINLGKCGNSQSVRYAVGASMPPSEDDIGEMAIRIADWLLSHGKKKFLFFLPEIAIFGEMLKRAKVPIEIYVLSPILLDSEARERLMNNLPDNVHVVEEHSVFDLIHPGDGMMVVTGYLAGEKLMVLPDVYMMYVNCLQIAGRKIFVPYEELDTTARYEGWTELDQQNISEVWRRSNG